MECDYFKVRYMELLNWEDMLVEDHHLPDSHPFIADKYDANAIRSVFLLFNFNQSVYIYKISSLLMISLLPMTPNTNFLLDWPWLQT